MVRALLALGADAVAQNDLGWIPLHLAATHSRDAVVFAMLENPFHVSTWASAQAETDDVQTAKHLAHCAGNKVREYNQSWI